MKLKTKANYSSPATLQNLISNEIEILPEIIKRVVVGTEGGLAYKLFPEVSFCHHVCHISQIQLDWSIMTANSFNRMKDYMNAIQKYLNYASNFAWKFDFGLVIAKKDNQITPFLLNSYITETSIGTEEIYNQKQVKKFIAMVKTGYIPLKNKEESVRGF